MLPDRSYQDRLQSLLSAGPAAEFEEFLELEKHADVHSVRMLGQDGEPAAGDLDDSATRPVDQPSLMQVGDGPVQPIGEQRRSARQRRLGAALLE